ncbi:hypothetical protein C5Y97_05375 [Blastopirellula marina]|uniref:Uncharacterized protein n=2 Tax=Blastopirellula marina TaxID=124 RepID=A0A2S8G877_9BACT|nr:hypothetical protein C5Y98_05375 [Blastopirellula marina]PTL45616.1 hypothetical protein C5Y97_05375 [Blastopirellula marina]
MCERTPSSSPFEVALGSNGKTHRHQDEVNQRSQASENRVAALGFDVVVDETYDALGRRTGLAAEIDGTDDLVNSYAYDYLNRMTQVTQGSQAGGNVVAEKRVNFSYDAEDKYQFTSISRYADLAGTELVATSTYGYDAADRLTSLTHADSSSSTLAGYTWGYDEGNRLTDFTVTGYSAEDATYTYDDTDQLTGADRSGTTSDESYTYDENGNRTGGSYSTGDNNQILSDGTYNYTYDDEGNRLTKTNISTGEVIEYSWDYRNRLVNITTKTSGGTVTHEVDYTYDIFNRRIGKTIDADGDGAGTATEEIYIYDGLREEQGNAGDHILLAFDENDDLTERMLYGPNVDQVLAQEDFDSLLVDGEVLWALTDHLNSARDVVSYDAIANTTTVENHITYDAFGDITGKTNAWVEFTFGFTGRERDGESDLQYNRARYYDAAIGKWVSEDPLRFDAGDENLYRYVNNVVTMLTDPSGLWTNVGLNRWRADTDEDSFLDLLHLVDSKSKLRDENVMGIIPVKSEWEYINSKVREKYNQNKGTTATAVACGEYDTATLTDSLPRSALSIGVGKDTNGNVFLDNANGVYGVEKRHLSKKGVDNVMQHSSHEGNALISSLVVVGHGGIGLDYVGDLNDNSKFELIPKGTAFAWSDYDKAIKRELSPAFWFASDAQVRLVGCMTSDFAEHFATNVLRGKDASAFGTSSNVWAGPYQTKNGSVFTVIAWADGKYDPIEAEGKYRVRGSTGAVIQSIEDFEEHRFWNEWGYDGKKIKKM